METFRTFCYLDEYGRLTVVSSTQVPFHVRRILSNALQIPKSRIRVVKPRIGGGFGAKQSVVSEIFPAIVTLKTGRAASIIYTREESMTNGSPRHQMQMKVRVGAKPGRRDSRYRLVCSVQRRGIRRPWSHHHWAGGTQGAFPLWRLGSGPVSTTKWYIPTLWAAGAYRGYGATQGIFAVESAVSELAAKLDMDPCVLREKNMVRTGPDDARLLQ